MTTCLLEPAHPSTAAEPRRTRTLASFWNDVQSHRGPGRRLVIGIDGRSGSGKTTLAATLASYGEHTATIHTDDLAWHHSFFGWSHLLIDNLLEPYHDGRTPVRYVPRAWQRRGRSGAITIPAATSTLIVEGVGAAARDIRRLLDIVIWVDTPEDIGRRRVLVRGQDSPAFIDDWLAQERAFLAENRPWATAHFVIDGTAGPPDSVAIASCGTAARTGCG